MLRPKTTAVLVHLLEHAGQVVSRDALLTAVWGDVAVTDDSVTQCISEIRRALGSDGSRMLQTLARRGYRMSTRLHPLATPGETAAPVGPKAAPPPETAAPISPTHALHGRVAWTGLVLVAALSAAAWFGANRCHAPAASTVVESPAPSTWDQAQKLLEDGRLAQSREGDYEPRLRASLPLFLRELALEPRMAEAAAEAAFVYTNLRTSGLSRDPDQDLREAVRYAALAYATSPELAIVLGAQAAVLRQQRRFAEALAFYKRAGADPERVVDRANVGVMHLLLGEAESAHPALRAALQEAPEARFSGNW